MKVYCVMRGESRTDLNHVVYASLSREKAEEFAKEYGFMVVTGVPDIEVLEVEE